MMCVPFMQLHDGTLLLIEDGRIMKTLTANPGAGRHPMVALIEPTPFRPSISSAADSHAKTYPLQDDEPALPEKGAASSMKQPASQQSLFQQEDGCLLRTSPACSVPTTAEISPLWSVRWATSGFTTSPGECWTADTSECPSEGAAFSSLPAVLVESSHNRFCLSPRAAAGIIRRATKRGRSIPAPLGEALQELAGRPPKP
jgi:hypothetical protein